MGNLRTLVRGVALICLVVGPAACIADDFVLLKLTATVESKSNLSDQPKLTEKIRSSSCSMLLAPNSRFRKSFPAWDGICHFEGLLAVPPGKPPKLEYDCSIEAIDSKTTCSSTLSIPFDQRTLLFSLVHKMEGTTTSYEVFANPKQFKAGFATSLPRNVGHLMPEWNFLRQNISNYPNEGRGFPWLVAH